MDVSLLDSAWLRYSAEGHSTLSVTSSLVVFALELYLRLFKSPISLVEVQIVLARRPQNDDC